MAPQPKVNVAEARHFTHLALHGPTGINRMMKKGMSFSDAHAHVLKGRQLAGKRAQSKGGADRAATWGHVVNTVAGLHTQERFNAFVASHNTKTAHQMSGFKKTSTFGQNSLKGKPTRNRASTVPKTKVAKPSFGSAPTKPMTSSKGRTYTGQHVAKSLGAKVKKVAGKRAKVTSHATTGHATRRTVGAANGNRGMAMKRGFYYRHQSGKRIKVKFTKRGHGQKRGRR